MSSTFCFVNSIVRLWARKTVLMIDLISDFLSKVISCDIFLLLASWMWFSLDLLKERVKMTKTKINGWRILSRNNTIDWLNSAKTLYLMNIKHIDKEHKRHYQKDNIEKMINVNDKIYRWILKDHWLSEVLLSDCQNQKGRKITLRYFSTFRDICMINSSFSFFVSGIYTSNFQRRTMNSCMYLSSWLLLFLLAL